MKEQHKFVLMMVLTVIWCFAAFPVIGWYDMIGVLLIDILVTFGIPNKREYPKLNRPTPSRKTEKR